MVDVLILDLYSYLMHWYHILIQQNHNIDIALCIQDKPRLLVAWIWTSIDSISLYRDSFLTNSWNVFVVISWYCEMKITTVYFVCLATIVLLSCTKGIVKIGNIVALLQLFMASCITWQTLKYSRLSLLNIEWMVF